MSGTLAGYDMLLAISQNEVNSQFSRMATGTNPIIETWIDANGLASAWGGPSYFLSTYLRAYVDAPTVSFTDPAAPDSHDHVFFNVTFRARTVTPADLDALGIDTGTLRHPMTTVDGETSVDEDEALACVLETLPVVNEPGQTVPNQAVYYWLRPDSQVGTTITWKLVPVTYFLSQGMHALVSLDGLTVSFKVMLSMLPTTPDALQSLVDDGLMDPSVLAAIDGAGFDQDIFSLQQLFLDFDTVDFTQWTLQAPPDETQVDVILIEPNALLSESLGDLTQRNPDFRAAFSSALQYAFGVGDTNTAGRTPYILGINAASADPGQSNPGADPSLVPTWIGYGAVSNPTNAGWSTINYQVLGGADPEARVPRAGDGSMVYVTDPMVASDAWSGALAFSEDAFFTPCVLQPMQDAVGIPGTWQQDGTRFSVKQKYTGKVIEDTGDDYTAAGEGAHGVVTEDRDYHCTLVVDGDTITLTGSYYQKQDYNVYVVVFGQDTMRFHWWYWSTVTFTQTVTMSIDVNNQLVFDMGAIQTQTDGPHEDENFGGSMVSAVSDLFSLLLKKVPSVSDVIDMSMNAMTSSLNSKVSRMNNNLIGGMSSNFISPTGDVFMMNGPRFNDALELMMDVTYRV